MKWALSVQDWHSHAIDERRDHPIGVFRAECGHRLAIVVELHDEPHGQFCEACAITQVNRALLQLKTE